MTINTLNTLNSLQGQKRSLDLENVVTRSQEKSNHRQVTSNDDAIQSLFSLIDDRTAAVPKRRTDYLRVPNKKIARITPVPPKPIPPNVFRDRTNIVKAASLRQPRRPDTGKEQSEQNLPSDLSRSFARMVIN